MKLVIVGGVAGGASAAARARRLDEQAEIVMFERGEFVSFANCGLPYYLGGEIEKRDELMVSTPEKFKKRFNLEARTFSEVVEIDRKAGRVKVKDRRSGEFYFESYDKLILSPGAEPIRPPLPGIELDSIFCLRDIPDADRILAAIEAKKSGSAVIVGGGFIGLEMAENLHRRGLAVSVVEMMEQVMAPLDYDMAAIIHNHLREQGVNLVLRDAVESFERRRDGRTAVRTGRGRELAADLVILAIGVKPETGLAARAGLELGGRGGILVDDRMRTSDPDIFAVGDAVEVRNLVSGEMILLPLAGPANKQGRIAADNALGRESRFAGAAGTSVVRIFELTAAGVGLNEKTLAGLGRPHLCSFTHSPDHASYYPGAERLSIKLVFEPGSGKLLGAQAVGKKGVDKRIDVLAASLSAGMTVFDLERLELAYAPPFGSARDPVNVAGFVAANTLRGDHAIVHWHELEGLDPERHQLLDVRDPDELQEAGPIPGALPLPLDELRSRLSELDRSKTFIAYCAIGLRSYLAYRILVQRGFEARNLSGGYAAWAAVQQDRQATDPKEG